MANPGGKRGGIGRKVVIGALGGSLLLLVVVAVPTLILLKHLVDRATCKSNQQLLFASIKAADKDNKLPAAPPGSALRDHADRSLSVLWEPFAKRKAVAEPGALLCPASSAPQERLDSATIGRYAKANFPRPRLDCFYSVRNVNNWTKGPTERVLFADRSPQDDGKPLSGNSANHHWGTSPVGQNVCFTSGAVAWRNSPNVGIDEDNIYAIGSDPSKPIAADSVPEGDTDTVLMPVSLVPDQE